MNTKTCCQMMSPFNNVFIFLTNERTKNSVKHCFTLLAEITENSTDVLIWSLRRKWNLVELHFYNFPTWHNSEFYNETTPNVFSLKLKLKWCFDVQWNRLPMLHCCMQKKFIAMQKNIVIFNYYCNFELLLNTFIFTSAINVSVFC